MTPSCESILSGMADSGYAALLQSLLDKYDEIALLMQDNVPLMINHAGREFFGVDTPEAFMREYGALESRFVPHDAYFHAGKVTGDLPWYEALMALPSESRIVSMLDSRIHPYAFAVDVDASREGPVTIFFRDISRELVKRIMIENDTTLDNESGAYAKAYFSHTSGSFIDAAAATEKRVGICRIELDESSDPAEAVTAIKRRIRNDDMVVRWGRRTLLLVYLTDTEENAMLMHRKAADALPGSEILTTLQNGPDTIEGMISRCEGAAAEAGAGPMV